MSSPDRSTAPRTGGAHVPATLARTLRIDVWFDLICPWCLIGKRNLDAALASWRRERPDAPVAVHWHSVRLIDSVPAEGWDYLDFYTRRLGSAAAVQARRAQVQAAAQRAGIQIAYERMRRFPDSAPAHQLLAQALQQQGEAVHAALIERLFDGYFQRGEDIGDRNWLVQLATEYGLDAASVRARLALPLPAAAPVQGVPLFVFDRQLALSGAQPPQVLLAALHRVATATAQTASADAEPS